MQESYGHRITAIHAHPTNMCDHCRRPALWETDYIVLRRARDARLES